MLEKLELLCVEQMADARDQGVQEQWSFAPGYDGESRILVENERKGAASCDRCYME